MLFVMGILKSFLFAKVFWRTKCGIQVVHINSAFIFNLDKFDTSFFSWQDHYIQIPFVTEKTDLEEGDTSFDFTLTYWISFLINKFNN
ncbi:hypothetical protein AR687_24675 [Flavobacteriaceae bacterium CRH]|nr:hypothetical protein AR687_24675 [Flavobacteriaceae bacterium CRH]